MDSDSACKFGITRLRSTYESPSIQRSMHMARDPVSGIFITFAIGIGVTLCVLFSGCAHVRLSKPCISGQMPIKRKIVTLRKPSPVPYQEEGVDKVGMDIVVEPDSMISFFQYVAELEDAAEKAQKCVER